MFGGGGTVRLIIFLSIILFFPVWNAKWEKKQKKIVIAEHVMRDALQKIFEGGYSVERDAFKVQNSQTNTKETCSQM